MASSSLRGLVKPAAATLIGVVFLYGCGNQELRRLAQEEARIATAAERAQIPPLAHEETMRLRCSKVDSAGMDLSCEYRRVRVKGVFDHSQERHVVAGVQDIGAGSTPGYWVFTPFWPVGTDRTGQRGPRDLPILVNRGFVPEAFKAPETRADGQTPGEVEIVAQVRTPEPSGWFDGKNVPEKNVYYVRTPYELGIPRRKVRPNALMLRAGPYYLEIVEGEPKGGLPKPLPAAGEYPNRYLAYARIWYGLAATLTAVFAVFAWTRLRRG